MLIKRFKFNLKEYFYETRKGFIFYETLVGKNKMKKLEFLKKLKIPVTSYRIAKQKEQNNGKEILTKLQEYFGLNYITYTQIEEYEETLSNLYRDIYYQNDQEINKGLTTIDSYIEQNNIMLPIFKLFKLLLIFMDTRRAPTENKVIYMKLYKELISFYDFFNEELKTIFLMIECLIDTQKIDTNIMHSLSVQQPYFKGMIYFILSLKAYRDKNYIHTIMYGKICEEELIKHQNYPRLWYVRMNMATSFNTLKHYGLAQYLCEENFLSLDSFEADEEIYKFTVLQYYIASVGLDQDEKVLNLLLEKQDKTIIEYLLMIVIKYKIKEMDTIDVYYNELMKQIDENNIYYNVVQKIYEMLKLKNVKPKMLLAIKGKINDEYFELFTNYLIIKKKA